MYICSFELTFSFKPKRTDVADVLNLEKLLILSSQFLQIRRDSPRVIFIPSTFSICCGKAFRFPGTLNPYGLHLNKQGSTQLAGNFIEYFKHCN